LDPRSIRIGAVVVAVLTALSASGAYYALNSAASHAATCSLSTTSSIVIDQPEIPDSLDPATAFTTPGWGVVQNVYQTLIFYNNSEYSPTSGPNYMEPMLAKNWSTSANGVHWNFTLFSHEYFSNGDPINAYVMWYSLYRGMVMNQPETFLLEENFFLPGLTYDNDSNTQNQTNSQDWLVGLLNSMDTLASVTTPSPDLMSVMEASNQSFQVINASTIEFNIGAGSVDSNGPAPHAFLLDQIATPGYAAVDPLYVAAHGGVTVNAASTWMANNMMGSGPYNLTFWSPSTGYTLVPNKNYWAQSIIAEYPDDNNLEPARSSIDVAFQENPTIVVENMETGAAALGSFGYIGPSQINQLMGQKCLVVKPLPPIYGAVSLSSWIYMDQNASTLPGQPINPFANLSVRAAVVHAINYNQIISYGFGGYGTKWVGPIPPGYPDYDPTNLPNYTYDLPLAKQEMNNSPWPMSTGGLTHQFPNGINFEYIQTGDWSTIAELLKTSLAAVDIPISLVPMSIDQLVEEQSENSAGQCISTTASDGGPFYIGLDYYSADYVGPDDPTELNAWSEGGYNLCMSEFASPQVDSWFFQAEESSSPAAAAQYYGDITNYMYYNYTDAWLVIPTLFQVYNVHVSGIIPNAMGSSIPVAFEYNTYTA
jgi:peptide/nickel transport system substrate-binding protein